MTAAQDFHSIDEVRAYHERVLGGHFFDEAHKFSSKIYPDIYPGREGWPIFVTSERQPTHNSGPHPRKYTVRQLNEHGGLGALIPKHATPGTIGGFGFFTTLASARRFAAKVAHDQQSPGDNYTRAS